MTMKRTAENVCRNKFLVTALASREELNRRRRS